MKRKWDSDDEIKQKKCVDEVIHALKEIGDSPVGIIAAQEIIDLVTENLAPEIYNKGVRAAKRAIAAKLSDVEIDLDLLEQKP